MRRRRRRDARHVGDDVARFERPFFRGRRPSRRPRALRQRVGGPKPSASVAPRIASVFTLSCGTHSVTCQHWSPPAAGLRTTSPAAVVTSTSDGIGSGGMPSGPPSVARRTWTPRTSAHDGDARDDRSRGDSKRDRPGATTRVGGGRATAPTSLAPTAAGTSQPETPPESSASSTTRTVARPAGARSHGEGRRSVSGSAHATRASGTSQIAGQANRGSGAMKNHATSRDEAWRTTRASAVVVPAAGGVARAGTTGSRTRAQQRHRHVRVLRRVLSQNASSQCHERGRTPAGSRASAPRVIPPFS